MPNPNENKIIANIVPSAGTMTVNAPTALYAAWWVSPQMPLIVVTTYPLCGSESSAPDDIATVQCVVLQHLRPYPYNVVRVVAGQWPDRPEDDPVIPAITLTAMAPPIKGLPGILVIALTAVSKAGTALATPPKPTTAAVFAIAIRACHRTIRDCSPKRLKILAI